MSTKFTVNPHRVDPYRNFKFLVKMDGRIVAGVNKISPLRRVTEVVEYYNGGEEGKVHKIPGRTTYDPLILEQGVTHDLIFEDWANLIYTRKHGALLDPKNFRKGVTIELLNLQGNVVKSYRVYECWVSEYQALPILDSNTPAVAIERITLEHNGWERDESVTEPIES